MTMQVPRLLLSLSQGGERCGQGVACGISISLGIQELSKYGAQQTKKKKQQQQAWEAPPRGGTLKAPRYPAPRELC